VSRLRSLAERAVFGADQVVELPGFPGPYADAYMAGVQAHALMASVRLGLWRHLPGTTDALARATGADPERLAVLLNALRALRYVRRRGDRWDAGRRARPWLGKDDGTGMDATVGELAWLNARGMLALDDIVRGGAPAGLHDRPEDDPAWDGYQASMVELHRQVHPVARTLVPAGARRVLDIGGGPGTFAIDLCRERPELQITVADLPGPAARGRERVREAGLEDRITYVEGDATTTDIGSGFDVATCNQLLHNVDRATATALLGAARRAVRSGGRVAVLDIDHERSRAGALASIVFLTWMGSRAWTGDEAVAMARSAGLREVALRHPVRLGGGYTLTGVAP
jgi:SAM-dependent methyltransferase